MPTFKSTNFTTQSPQATPLREWQVNDIDYEQNNTPINNENTQFLEMENAARAAKEARQIHSANMSRINGPAKLRIELLADIGRLTKDVKIGEHTFSLRTLKGKETKEAALVSFGKEVITQLEAGYEARRQQLARSLFKIDGNPINEVIGANGIDAVLSFIDDYLEESIITKLFDEFSALKEEARAQFDIKSDAEAKEVAEDLKKL